MIKGVEHIAIASFEPRKLTEWYAMQLSFTIILDTGTTLYLQAANGIILEFVHAETHADAPRVREAGLRNIAFSADDLVAARKASCRVEGCSLQMPPLNCPACVFTSSRISKETSCTSWSGIFAWPMRQR